MGSGKALVRPVVPLDPRAASGLLPALGIEASKHALGEGGRVAGGQDRPQLLVDQLGRGVAEDGDVGDAVEQEAVGRQLQCFRPGEEDLLRPEVRRAGGLLVGKAGGVDVAGEGLPFRIGWAARSTFGVGHRGRVWQRGTGSAVRQITYPGY